MSDLGVAERNAETRAWMSAQTSASVVDDASASPWPGLRPLTTGALGGSDASPDILYIDASLAMSIHEKSKSNTV